MILVYRCLIAGVFRHLIVDKVNDRENSYGKGYGQNDLTCLPQHIVHQCRFVTYNSKNAMQHTHHIRNYKVNLNLTANTAFYHTPVIAHTLEDIVIIPIIGDSRQVLKIEDTTGCDQEDNGGKCNQQIGGAVLSAAAMHSQDRCSQA